MLTQLKRAWRQWRCKHDPVFIRNLYGDEIIEHDYKRSLWGCRKCGCLLFHPDLHMAQTEQEPKKEVKKMEPIDQLPNTAQFAKFQTTARRNSIKALIATFYEVDDAPHLRAVVGHPDLVLTPYPPGLSIEKNSIRIGDQAFDTVLLSLNPEAIRGYVESDDGISFKCRFAGRITDVFVGYDSIIAVGGPVTGLYQTIDLDSNGKLLKMALNVHQTSAPVEQRESPTKSASQLDDDTIPTQAKGRPTLRVVK